MITVINVTALSKICPKDMNESVCPLRKFMKNQNILHPTVNNSVFEFTKPYPQIREEYIKTMDKIYEICDRCKGQR